MLIDTHSHIYLPHFDNDRNEVIKRAVNKGITNILLPNIDSKTIKSVFKLSQTYPEICYPMMGLHPTSVKQDFEKELEIIDTWFEKEKFIAVGESGIDLYWDKTFAEEQKIAFSHQIKLAKKYNLPIIIHARGSFKEIYSVMEKEWDNDLKGVFHSFTGDIQDVKKINDFGFMFGINGIITFKNSDLKDTVKHIDINNILIETDSPYLAPVPKRGKRNESSYITYIAVKLAEIFNISFEEISHKTTTNAKKIFKINA